MRLNNNKKKKYDYILLKQFGKRKTTLFLQTLTAQHCNRPWRRPRRRKQGTQTKTIVTCSSCRMHRTRCGGKHYEKMRVELKHFDIKIDADLTDEHPKKYESMKLIYEFKGDDLPVKKN